MMYDRMDPLTPIKDPIVVNNGLSSIKPVYVVVEAFSLAWNVDHAPSATIANPEYAFSTVITTATYPTMYEYNNSCIDYDTYACQRHQRQQWSCIP